MNEDTPKRYNAAPLETADTYRISDSHNGAVVAVVKGREAVRKRLDQLNAEETLRRRAG